MPPAARVSDPTTHGAPLAPGPGSTNVMIGSQPAWRAMVDQHACPATSVSGPDGVGAVTIGSPTVLINNQMACRQMDIVIEKPGLAMGPINPIIMGCLTVIIGDAGTPSAGLLPPGVAPSAPELQNNPVVQTAMGQAWQDSQAGDPVARHEEGGWIYMDPNTGRINVVRAPVGAQASVNLDNPPTVPGSVVVGVFHTHPNPTSEGWDPGPSPADQRIDARDGIPDLIRADDGNHVSGPNSRRGGLGGGPGYPP
jgi:uncharacterized Zn-binding protein involved in type VI secretion